MRKRKGLKTDSVLIILIGILITLSPMLYNGYTTYKYNKYIEKYNEELNKPNTYEINRAIEYNKYLSEKPNQYTITGLERDSYSGMLNSLGTGMMGYIDIPKIDVYLPIYKGTSENVLQSGIGWLEGSSLPVGGDSSNSVLTGHSGLLKAKMFTDLRDLELNDTVRLVIEGGELFYSVVDTVTVLPEDVSYLDIEEGKDLLTLYTCTPIGLNTHRLIVICERIDDISAVDSASTYRIGFIEIFYVLVFILLILRVIYIKLGGSREKDKTSSNSSTDCV